MRPPHRSLRALIAPALVGLHALVLASCEPVQPLLVQQPMTAEEQAAADLNRYHSAKSIVVTSSDSSLAPGEQAQAKAAVLDQRGTLLPWAPITWTSSSSDVAAISSTGVITAGTTAGTATISAFCDGITATVTVTVVAADAGHGDGADTTAAAGADGAGTDGADGAGTQGADTTAAVPDSAVAPSAPVHMVSISANATTLKVGESTQISGVVRDATGTPIANVPITWTTSPVAVATIATTTTTSGLLTAKSAGTATVFAKADTAVRYITVTVVDDSSVTAGSPSAPVPAGASGGSYGTATAAELPRLSVSTAYPTANRQTRVPAGADLQAAIDAAQPGDELLLAPGAVYSGNFYLRNKGAVNGWITIRTDVSDAAIGAAGTRMTPTRAASANLARIITPNIYSAITTEIGANHYRFTGVEIGVVASGPEINTIVRLGDNTSAQNGPAATANNLVFDRTYIHGSSSRWLRRCVMLNSASTAIVDSWVSECHSNSGDSQAIVGWNGPGPFLIQNNYLEAGHEVIMFGGGGVTVQNVSPSDITIRGNHITRPSSWKGVWQVKNLIESKHSRRLLIEGNVIENTWMDAQVGYAFVLKSENQDWDTPWTQTTDVTVRQNVIRNVGAGFNIAANPSGAPAVPAARIVITDNVMENVGNAPYLGDGRIFQLLGGVNDVVVMHNTLVGITGGSSAAIYFGAMPSLQRFVVHSNVLAMGAYGIKGDSYGAGTPSLNLYASGSLVTNNALVSGGTAASYPANNYFPATLGSIGFVDAASGNYRLSASSSYLGKGYDGRDIGVDMNQLDALTRGAVVAP